MGTLKYLSDILFSNDKEVLTEDSGYSRAEVDALIASAIPESGTFSGGGWTKYPDGTAIEWWQGATGSLDYYERNYVVDFLSTPAVSVSANHVVEGQPGYYQSNGYSTSEHNTKDKIRIDKWRASVSPPVTTPNGFQVAITAIGRWK